MVAARSAFVAQSQGINVRSYRVAHEDVHEIELEES
jgi:hypothetical protein